MSVLLYLKGYWVSMQVLRFRIWLNTMQPILWFILAFPLNCVTSWIIWDMTRSAWKLQMKHKSTEGWVIEETHSLRHFLCVNHVWEYISSYKHVQGIIWGYESLRKCYLLLWLLCSLPWRIIHLFLIHYTSMSQNSRKLMNIILY